ncbi:calcium-dependent protein kinase 1 [Cyclospora cayetanensis]|nr:calcium-dependent protein kinase 1 [Cyclospora cayetanensis]
MELCSGKELYERLAKKKKYSERDAARITMQMLAAVNYCHQHSICHRDLKLENWVYLDEREDAPLKLIDFGFSCLFKPNNLMSAMHGTVYYVAPEVMDGKYDQLCDVWSIGVIVYMLLSGTPPFAGSTDQEILVKIRRCQYTFEGPRWQGVSPQAKCFISGLLKRNPHERLSAAQALSHPWLAATETELRSHPINLDVLKCMQRFAACSIIQRAALGLIALSMPSSKDLEELERLFWALDAEGTGTIRVEGLVETLVAKLNIPEAEALHIFQRIDQTGDQEINYSEFLAATFQTQVALSQSLIREAFERLDADHSGEISLANLRQILGDSYGGLLVEDILAQCDIKKNGVIDFEEFMTALVGTESSSSPGGCLLLKLPRAEQSQVLSIVERNLSGLANVRKQSLSSELSQQQQSSSSSKAASESAGDEAATTAAAANAAVSRGEGKRRGASVQAAANSAAAAI